jgi:RNA recognition motif-containing protein
MSTTTKSEESAVTADRADVGESLENADAEADNADHPAVAKGNDDGPTASQEQHQPPPPPQQQQQERRIHHHHQHQNTRKMLTGRTVFVTGLAHGLARIHLEKLFQKFGMVERLDIKDGKTSMASRYCFVEFDAVENAQKAMDNLNGRMLLHTRLVVQPAVERDSSTNGATGHGGLSSSSNMSPAREGKLLDKKIEELKRKINAAKK